MLPAAWGLAALGEGLKGLLLDVLRRGRICTFLPFPSRLELVQTPLPNLLLQGHSRSWGGPHPIRDWLESVTNVTGNLYTVFPYFPAQRHIRPGPPPVLPPFSPWQSSLVRRRSWKRKLPLALKTRHSTKWFGRGFTCTSLVIFNGIG